MSSLHCSRTDLYPQLLQRWQLPATFVNKASQSPWNIIIASNDSQEIGRRGERRFFAKFYCADRALKENMIVTMIHLVSTQLPIPVLKTFLFKEFCQPNHFSARAAIGQLPVKEKSCTQTSFKSEVPQFWSTA